MPASVLPAIDETGREVGIPLPALQIRPWQASTGEPDGSGAGRTLGALRPLGAPWSGRASQTPFRGAVAPRRTRRARRAPRALIPLEAPGALGTAGSAEALQAPCALGAC